MTLDELESTIAIVSRIEDALAKPPPAKCENCSGLNCPAADGSGPCQNPNGVEDDPMDDDS